MEKVVVKRVVRATRAERCMAVGRDMCMLGALLEEE